MLDASRIQDENGSIHVTGFSFDSFLPSNRDYYFYMGSLTAPLCDENVAWFIMKDTITVPGSYLDQLRDVIGDDGNRPLTYNFRDPQELGDRVVKTNSQAIVKPVLTILLFCLVTIGLL